MENKLDDKNELPERNRKNKKRKKAKKRHGKLTESRSPATEDNNRLEGLSSTSCSKKRDRDTTGSSHDSEATSAPSEDVREGGSSSNRGHHSDQSIGSKRSLSPVLEGAMVEKNKIMVLIDRKNGKVYSATERRKNGKRKRVGTLDKEGEVVWKKKKQEAKQSPEKKSNVEMNPSVTTSECQDLGNDSTSTTQHPTDDPIIFPFDTDPDDHCESPLEAYQDILPLLQSYARTVHPQHPCSHLSVYDPYYCNGGVKKHLKSLGFPNVYNCKEDCYEVWNNASKYPDFHMLVTNPPYSGDHIERLMKHVTDNAKCNKPWMLLMPTFVHKKDYFVNLTRQARQQPIYLIPHKRYVYQPPTNFRSKRASDTHKKSSPFVSMWYLWGGSPQMTDQWYRILLQEQQRKMHSVEHGENNNLGFDVARSKSTLRDLRRKGQRTSKGRKK
ncbi:hypothetical protein IV203_006330 [Nitzschia inconspicua]|uniref:Uncharacterized protein n=1 Tax=Nitzschia inconspicua TaxID=303405 RepID=A0A9K3K8F9_9STRA|nr:hypothetical protein IV203_006330 [Nitzschia inconspicua]